jgi:hypothetical protein
MTRPDPTILRLYGEGESTPFDEVPVDDPAAERLPEGASLPATALSALLGVASAWASVAGLPFALLRAPGHGAAFAVEATHVLHVRAGERADRDDLCGVEASGGLAVCDVLGDDGRPYTVAVRDGALKVWRAALHELDAPAEAPPSVAAPEVRAWAQAAEAEPWLAEAAEDLVASPAPVDVAAGVGLLARLYARPEHVPASEHPRVRAQAWARALTAEQRDAVEDAAVRRAWSLVERIAGLADAADGTHEADLVVEARDDLQSVRRVLRLAGAGERLARALDAVDRTATTHLSTIAALASPMDEGDPRWATVAWQEPDAWWTGLA